jgi:hypothetical protein
MTAESTVAFNRFVQFKLKFVLLSFVWLFVSLPRWREWLIERQINKSYQASGLIICWVPWVPTWTAFALTLAAILTFTGYWRIGSALGGLTAAFAAYCFVNRWNGIKALGIDPTEYWRW